MKTAVEWLEDNLIFEPWAEDHFKHNSECWDKAKEMEKEQIVRAYDEAKVEGMCLANNSEYKHLQGFEYYNETFKSE
jgi:hypothetical protein